jgi:acyl-CoA synthetase (AMP-forming)/AMP-acid ligase II
MSSVPSGPDDDDRARRLNIADRLRRTARERPHQRGVVIRTGRDRFGRAAYAHLTFGQLDQEADRLARGLVERGLRPGMRIALMVRPGLEFIALTFAVFRTGAVVVLIDPGMGRTNIFRCLAEVRPDGFVAIPIVQAIRAVNRGRFPAAKINVTVDHPVLWGTTSYEDLRGGEWTPFAEPPVRAGDPAAILFTSGSTGPPKGVLYEHGMFDAQVDLLREFYGIEPGEIDLPGFPLFALFNAALGVTTVIPDMDPTKPAQVDPTKILEALRDQGVTQAFGSPALWNVVGRHCERTGTKLPATLMRVLSAGAPVPVPVIERMLAALPPEGDVHTPYGATESLPVCSIGGREIVGRTAARSRAGEGTCVGRPFPRMQVRIVAIHDGPLETIAESRELPTGEIGEVLVRGPVVTREYFLQPEATALAKVRDGDGFWHRMGDVGRLDADGALWFCGRKAHVVETAAGRMFPIPCEAVFNQHPEVFRSALVGIGPRPRQEPAIVIEPESGRFPQSASERERLTRELRGLGAANPLTARIGTVLFHPSFPVDIRHNVKIFREKLADWAAEQVRGAPPP